MNFNSLRAVSRKVAYSNIAKRSTASLNPVAQCGELLEAMVLRQEVETFMDTMAYSFAHVNKEEESMFAPFVPEPSQLMLNQLRISENQLKLKQYGGPQE